MITVSFDSRYTVYGLLIKKKRHFGSGLGHNEIPRHLNTRQIVQTANVKILLRKSHESHKYKKINNKLICIINYYVLFGLKSSVDNYFDIICVLYTLLACMKRVVWKLFDEKNIVDHLFEPKIEFWTQLDPRMAVRHFYWFWCRLIKMYPLVGFFCTKLILVFFRLNCRNLFGAKFLKIAGGILYYFSWDNVIFHVVNENGIHSFSQHVNVE